MNRNMEIRKGVSPLVYAIAERVSLPLGEITRQIQGGLCRVGSEKIDNPWFGVIVGCRIELGQTVKFVV